MTFFRCLVLILISTAFLSCETSDPKEVNNPSGTHQSVRITDFVTVDLGPQSKLNYDAGTFGSDRLLEIDGEAAITANRPVTVRTSNGIVSAEKANFRIISRRSTLVANTTAGIITTSNIDNGAKKEIDALGYVVYNGKNMSDYKEVGSEQLMTSDEYWVFHSASIMFTLECIGAEYGFDFDTSNIDVNKVYNGLIPRDNMDIALGMFTTALGLSHTKEGNKVILQ